MEPCLRHQPLASAPPGPCGRLAEFRRDLDLCARLEQLADALPDLPDSLWMQQTLAQLDEASDRWAASVPLPGVEGADPARRLFDSAQADDVAEELRRYWMAPDPSRVGQLSYMLRALFEGRTRAMTIERLCLGCARCAYSAVS